MGSFKVPDMGPNSHRRGNELRPYSRYSGSASGWDAIGIIGALENKDFTGVDHRKRSNQRLRQGPKLAVGALASLAPG